MDKKQADERLKNSILIAKFLSLYLRGKPFTNQVEYRALQGMLRDLRPDAQGGN